MGERRSSWGLHPQLRYLTPLLVVWTIAAALLAVVGAQDRTPLDQLFLDANYLGNQPWYTGLISDIGILVWTVSAVASVGGAWVAEQTGRRSAAVFLGAAGVVSAIFLADDLLQLHGEVLLGRGVPKPLGQALIIAPAIAWLVGFLGEIRRTRWLVLLAALAALAGSVTADAFGVIDGSTALFIEDGLKLLGVLAWALYLVLTAMDITRSTITAARVRVRAGAPAGRFIPS